MRGKFEELAVIIQIASTISKRLPVRCIVVTKTLRTVVIKTLRPINEHRYLALYLFCGSRGCDHRNGRFVCSHRQCRIDRQVHNRRSQERASRVDPGTKGAISPAHFNFVSQGQPIYDRKGRPRQETVLRYIPPFRAAFPKEGLAPESIAKAIATYERTVVSGRAPFDVWIEGDEKAISEQAKRGFTLFNTKAGCSNCHSGWNFTDDSFHDTGLPDGDIGRGKFFPSVVKMGHAFKTPGLREITRRGPYMHDGSVPSLEAVMDHYNNGGINRLSRSDQIKPLGLSKQEMGELVVFMKTMTSDMAPTAVPILPR